MTLSEFKAWFEGYTEGLDGAPTEKQFKRIKAKVAEITGTPISQTVFIDRYRDYHHYWQHPVWGGAVGIGYSAGSISGNVGNAVLVNATGARPPEPFDSISAMYAVGKADALAA
jgi:hypothetical protein